MREEKKRLIDEALEDEPIKNSFRLGWEFIRLNQKFTLSAMAILIALNLFSMLPIGSFLILFSGVFGMIIQIHAGRTLYGTHNIDSYINEIEETKLEEITKQYVPVALGGYLAWIVLVLLSFILLGIVGGMSGLISEGMDKADLLNAVITLGFPFLVIALLLSYVQPLVQSNIIVANSFQEGFKAVFSLFSVEVWRSSFNKRYFNYMALFGLLLLGLMFVVSAIMAIVMMVPLLGNMLSVIIVYFLMVIMAMASMMARRMVERVSTISEE